MRRRVGIKAMIIILAFGIATPLGLAADVSQDVMTKYILATVKAFRTVYAKGIVEQAKKAGVKPNENWTKDDHAIMLPAQFVKAAGAELKDFELGLIGLTPIYKSNLPKTQAETDALKKMMSDPNTKVLTFADGDQFKGLAADFAIVQSCADCHNQHPSSPKKDFKLGDLMGAIVVRFSH
ncbi:MAG: c-type heme family protein [Nitrospiraceae bacterium]